MGKSNLLAGLERKLGHALGELEAKRAESDRIERLVETLPAIHERIQHLEAVVASCEFVIKDGHPDWQRDTIDPIRPQVHQIPISLGEAGRKALEVLRDAERSMSFRDIAREMLRREGLTDYNQATLDKVTNTIGNSLRKKRGTLVESDNLWPAKWWVIR